MFWIAINALQTVKKCCSLLQNIVLNFKSDSDGKWFWKKSYLVKEKAHSADWRIVLTIQAREI